MLEPVRERAYGAGGSNLVLMRAVGIRLGIGGFALPDATLYTLDMTGVIASMRAPGVSVPRLILGNDVLRAHGAFIDYAGSRLWLRP